jgi:hypothetical protein
MGSSSRFAEEPRCGDSVPQRLASPPVRRHRRRALRRRPGDDALGKADRAWLGRLITRRVPLERWHEAFEKRDDDVKVVLDFGKL